MFKRVLALLILLAHTAERMSIAMATNLVQKMMPYYEAAGEPPVYPLNTDSPPS